MKRLEGQLSIYAALSFMVITSLLVALIRSCIITDTIVETDMALRLSTEAVFAGFDKKLFERFGLMGLDKDECVNAKLMTYLKKNLKGISDDKAEYMNSEIGEIKALTDSLGLPLKKQARDFAKYKSLKMAADEIFDVNKESKKAQVVKSLTESIIDASEMMIEADAYKLNLIEHVDGLRTSDQGLIIHNKRPQINGRYMAKSIIDGPVTQDKVYIKPDEVFGALNEGGKFVDTSELLDGIIDAFEIRDEESFAYQTMLDKLVDLVNGVAKETDDAIEAADKRNNKKDELIELLDLIGMEIEENAESLGQDLKEGLDGDLRDLKDASGSDSSMCNVEFMQRALLHNRGYLKKLKLIVDRIKAENDFEKLKLEVDEFKDNASKLSYELLEIDYSDVNFDADSDGLEKLKKLREKLENGLFGLVFSGIEISEKSQQYDNLACDYMGMEGLDDFDPVAAIENASKSASKSEIASSSNSGNDTAFGGQEFSLADELLFDQYIGLMFNDFLNASSKENVGGIKAYGDYDHKLDYQVEYILSGLKSDKANLSGVALKISLVREGINFSYALLNKEKRAAAMKLATSLAGASGNVGLVKAVQITILALWAYAEGLYDVRRLVKGEELPAIKNDDDWKLDLDGIFDLAFDEIEGEADRQNDGKSTSKYEESDSGKKKSENAFERYAHGKVNYSDYLRILLKLEDGDKKALMTCSAIELEMIPLKGEDFRLKNFKAEGLCNVVVKLPLNKKLYSAKLSYKYA